ncbi:protein modifier of snc1 1 [Phtheirospermum japonicum]|uniref:Protein modifier of snc1 1 n=1 Tax=Phtheirospermum japonicum TaxID=374723 RepID=A0A830B3K5_9LAMI|nr:protein modifier of snc1 1 [Phtheirospermum japonicum]
MTLALQLDNEFQYVGWGAKDCPFWYMSIAYLDAHSFLVVSSNLLRWASARRGGMTVLGKVAVPKPLNLPSQRLENHGLDPNVEIVPKGTLSWGSRPSSSGSNPWVSSSPSPNTEGGNVSPSHLSGRPSSGGSGTRPSTAGSERTHEPVANSWGSNSRPSSASGTLSSNQTSSTSLRPRSAENRPNSSQLSRFADPVSKSSAAWGPSGTAERLGVKSSKEDGFSLSTGDFPTLGTEKDNSTKNSELEDHGRPSSASGIISHGKEDTRSQADVKHGTVNTWRADGPQGADDDIHPSMEKWHGGDNPQYFNSPTAPQHFDAWRGPPMNGPASVWYGGGPRGPPFGAPVRPGGFPLEPFPYYRPQIAPPPLAGSQPVPPQGPRGPHPKNGDLYRPQLPDAYARPGMPPFRPGFYPGPPGPPGPMAFESFYGPPMGYERDLPYMGMAAGPPVYNSSYPGPAPDLGSSHGRNGRGHHGGKTSSEQMDSEDNTQGPKRVTLKSRNQCDQREEGEAREHNVQQSDVSYPEKNRLPIISSRKSEWGAEEDTDEAMYAKRRAPSEKHSHNFEHMHSADGVKVKSFDGMGNAKAVHDNWSNVPKSGPSFPPEMSQVHPGSERDSSVPAVTKNSTLMQKIDGLNAKIRVSDGRNDSPSVYNRDEERNRSQVTDMKVNNNTGKVNNTVGSFERTPASRDFVSVPHEVTVPVSDKPTQPMIASRRQHHGGQQGRVDHRGKGKFNGQDADGWRKKPLTAEASSAVTASHNESPHSSHAHCPNNVEEASESSVINNPAGKMEGDSVETHDSIDIQAQMRESVKQRALQLQKEEEERTREQRAKALAKLEELNRRTLAGEAVSEKADKSEVINAIQGERDDSLTVGELVMAGHNNANQAGESVEIPKNLPVESNVSTLPEHEDAHDNSVEKPAPQHNDSKHKRTGYKQKQSNPLQKSFAEKLVSNVAAEPQKDHTSGVTEPSESNMANMSDTVVEPPAPQRRKNNRSGKNKQHKLDETPLPPPVGSTNVNPGKESIENVAAKDTLSDWDSAFSIEPDKSMQAQEVLTFSSPNEESHSRVSNQWKPHPSRRLPRNQQANNKVHGSDNTAVWAPVRTQNKAKGPVEISPNPVQESTNSMKGNNNNMGQNSLRGKRAEMERYVPKPVAKELAQQVNVPNSSSSVTSSRSNDWSMGEVNEGDIGHNKHRKDQGTWKQQGPLTDSSHLKGAHSTSESTKEIQLSREIIGQTVKSEIDSVNAGDGYNLPNNNTNTAKYPSVKDQGVTGRGKRNGPKGPAASTGNSNNNNNPDHEKTFSGEVDVNQIDRTKENRASSHWQPKSSSNTANNQQHGNRTESMTTETNRFPKKEHPQHKAAQGGNFSQTPQPGQSANVKSNVVQESTVGHRQEFEKRAKSRPYSPNQDPVGPGELPPAATEDVCFERNVQSGSRRNNRQSNRSGRGHEPRGEWASGHDNRPHNAPPFRDNRQRQNLHYEYQPVGPFKGNRPERVEEPADGADSTDKRHRERGQGQSRRGGNFNRRQSGPAAHVDSSGWE